MSETYWDESYPPDVLNPPPPVATGVTAGTPGAFTPPTAPPPADLAALVASGLKPTPATAWTTGQFVVLGDASHAYWNGTTWLAGEVPEPEPPEATGATAGEPGTFTPAGSRVPADLDDLEDVTASPATAWPEGAFVALGDDSHAYWDGTAWVEGDAPADETDGGDE